jgi:lipoprotein-releasing system ATP-binding protein
MALVEIRDIHKSYEHNGRTLEVLRGIDLTINAGELIAIVGPSGTGKSTLLHCIGTLDLPSTGEIVLDDLVVTKLPSNKLAELRNRAIGFVFQFHHLLPEFTALENVAMPGLIQGKTLKEMTPRARELLEVVGLKDRASHRPGELSGGEQQRVAVARALSLEPKILLADEPTGNLDTATSDAIHDLFFRINKERGTTIVVVTHNAAFAEQMPRVVRMRDGKVEKDDRGTSAHHRENGKASLTPAPEADAEETEAAS